MPKKCIKKPAKKQEKAWKKKKMKKRKKFKNRKKKILVKVINL
jgi:hypothetical protein